MKIKTELIKGYIAEAVCSQLSDFEIDEDAVADSRAILILEFTFELFKYKSTIVSSIIKYFSMYCLYSFMASIAFLFNPEMYFRIEKWINKEHLILFQVFINRNVS